MVVEGKRISTIKLLYNVVVIGSNFLLLRFVILFLSTYAELKTTSSNAIENEQEEKY